MARKRRGGGTGRQPRSVREGQDVTFDVARAGRSGTGAQPEQFITRSTGTPGGIPTGSRTTIPSGLHGEGRRALEMENSAAVILAEKGWRITQNPMPAAVAQARHEAGDVGSPATKPDYLLEGRVFDCYSPTNPTKTVRGVWSYVRDEKVNKLQTQRVVINLEQWTGNLAALRKQFAEWPMDGLKEVKVITADGDIVQFELPPRTD
jgi:hypothetical protein